MALLRYVEHVEHHERAEHGVKAVVGEGKSKPDRVGFQDVRHGDVHLHKLSGDTGRVKHLEQVVAEPKQCVWHL